MVGELNLTAFSDAVDDVTGAITGTVAPGLVGIAVVALGVTLSLAFLRKIRSAI